MSSVRKPRIPKLRRPKIKKPKIKRVNQVKRKMSILSKTKVAKTNKIVSEKKITKKNHKTNTTKKNTGTCYIHLGCRKVIARDVSKSKCKNIGGKSWKKSGCKCEELVEK